MTYLDTQTGQLTDEADIAIAMTGSPAYTPAVHDAILALLETRQLVALPFAISLPEAA
jgi:hypothetical protein